MHVCADAKADRLSASPTVCQQVRHMLVDVVGAVEPGL